MNPSPQKPPRGISVAILLSCYVAIRTVRLAEWPRMQQNLEEVGVLGWLFNWSPETTPYAILLAMLPAIFFARNIARTPAQFLFGDESHEGAAIERLPLWIGLACVMGLALSFHVGVSRIAVSVAGDAETAAFGDLPPAFHDEYSYRFQTQTFLAGRTSFPAPEPHADIFNQMHVLNEGYVASRYFPAVGAWLAPFLALGNIYVAQWVAGMLAAGFVFLTGRELGGNLCGLIAGSLLAISPGIGLFGNLLLAHHPTLLGLSAFLYFYLRWMKTQRRLLGIAAGIGLTFAMLARPMSAAGFALPMGIHLFVSSFVGCPTWAERMRRILTVGSPVLCGFAALMAYNASITGNAFKTPYQLYTDIYTPRHVYGFNNVERGEQKLGPKVIEKYDTWAENLTLPLALRNAQKRVLASFQWTLGFIPIACGVAVMFCLWPASDWRRRLVFLSLVSLHVAHLPYWFVGIMNWHYVFESALLLVLLLGLAVTELGRHALRRRRPLVAMWCLVFAGMSVIPNLTSVSSLWDYSKLDHGIGELSFPRRNYEQFDRFISQNVSRPALVLVIHDPDDRHIDYITNSPTFDAPVLLGRLADVSQAAEIARSFPDRSTYVYTAATGRLEQVADGG